jgi:peptidyl-prolyl cis-trans isomerase C
MMNKRVAIALLLFVLGAVGACGTGKREAEAPRGRRDEIVRVGAASLSAQDIDNLIPQEEGIPPTLEERKQFVKRWVDTEILYQEAMRRGLKNDPHVQARLQALEQEFLADYLVFTELKNRTTVTEDEIEAYFAVHEREYMNEYRVSQILVNTPEEAAQVQELLKKRDFAWVANRFSVDPVTKRGGDLGYLTKGNMLPELEGVIFDMKPGDISGVIKSDFGYHIFKLVDVREALVAVGLDDVREQIANALMIEKRKKTYAAFIDSLRASAAVAYVDKEYMPGTPTPAEVDTAGMPGEFDTTSSP